MVKYVADAKVLNVSVHTKIIIFIFGEINQSEYASFATLKETVGTCFGLYKENGDMLVYIREV